MGTSYNQREVDAYQATIDLAKMISSLIKNPPDLKGPVEESIRTIKEAKEASQKLQELRAATTSEIGLAKADLAQKAAEHAKHKANLDEVSSHLEGRERGIESREREANKKADLLIDYVADKGTDINAHLADSADQLNAQFQYLIDNAAEIAQQQVDDIQNTIDSLQVHLDVAQTTLSIAVQAQPIKLGASLGNS